jgi:hypothetical protein
LANEIVLFILIVIISQPCLTDEVSLTEDETTPAQQTNPVTPPPRVCNMAKQVEPSSIIKYSVTKATPFKSRFVFYAVLLNTFSLF